MLLVLVFGILLNGLGTLALLAAILAFLQKFPPQSSEDKE
jgi:hypothetical protein